MTCYNCKALGKPGTEHCCGNIMSHAPRETLFPKRDFASQDSGSKNVSKQIQKHFYCGTNVSTFAHMFPMFPARET